jgi:hypothetical protein
MIDSPTVILVVEDEGICVTGTFTSSAARSRTPSTAAPPEFFHRTRTW